MEYEEIKKKFVGFFAAEQDGEALLPMLFGTTHNNSEVFFC